MRRISRWPLFAVAICLGGPAASELRQSNQQNPTIRTGIALTQFKLGNVAEARSIRDEMMNDRNLNLANGANVRARRLLKLRIT